MLASFSLLTVVVYILSSLPPSGGVLGLALVVRPVFEGDAAD